MKKLIEIDNKMILLTIEATKVNEIAFSNCYNNDGLLSVRHQGRRYYCRDDQDYYFDNKYALVNNLDKLSEAKNSLIENKIDFISMIMKDQEKAIQKKKRRIEELLKLKK